MNSVRTIGDHDYATTQQENSLARVLIIDQRKELAAEIEQSLSQSHRVELVCTYSCEENGSFDAVSLADLIAAERIDTIVFSPLLVTKAKNQPDTHWHRQIVETCKQAGLQQFVLISSAEIYGATHHNPGLLRETAAIHVNRQNHISTRWSEIETTATQLLEKTDIQLTILRPCYMLHRETRNIFQRLLSRRFAFTLFGRTPTIQVLSVSDFASAITAAVSRAEPGIFNIAPDSVVGLRNACRTAGVTRIPLPFSLHWLIRKFRYRAGSEKSVDDLQFLRFSWTVSNAKAKSELGAEFQHSSIDAIRQSVADSSHVETDMRIGSQDSPIDPFGMEKKYIERCSRGRFSFCEKVYWRVNSVGLENIPAEGGAILAGIHRGFMPFDGVLMVHMLSKYRSRIPRFLMHPALVKFAHLDGFLNRIGGIGACKDNADYVLERDEILGIFPEGVRGAFRKYDKDVYEIGNFGRSDFVRMAIRHGVPIIPFVTLGPAESFPILAKFEWRWFKRLTEWPCFPVTPTWPLLPIPLPAKWHFRILEPIDVREFGATSPDDHRAVAAISKKVRADMQSAIDEMRSCRKSIFFGSLQTNSNASSHTKQDSAKPKVEVLEQASTATNESVA